MANGSLMKIESIAEYSPWSILQYFWPSLSDNRLENQFLMVFFLSDHLRQKRQVSLYLPTKCIFKGKWKPKDVVLPKGCVLQMNNRAWMNEEVMLKWVREVLHPYTQWRPALLAMSFFQHIYHTESQDRVGKDQYLPSHYPWRLYF